MNLILTVLFASGVLHAQNLEIVTPKKSQSYALKELKSKLKTFTVKIDDPVYKTKKEYDAFDLKDILQLAGVEPSQSADEIVYTSVDGYSPNMPFDAMKDHRALVAYQEHATPGRFAMLNHGKAKISPWPYYLVWEDGPKAGNVPWPYQLVKIELVDWKQKYPLVLPTGQAADSLEMKGFTTFKAECIRCHSINLQGGDLGPELNAPKNVTEYWKPDILRSFIQDTGQFRYKDKMPSFKNLSSDQLDGLIAYLKFMKDHKIKTP